jgi:hypothetical protein
MPSSRADRTISRRRIAADATFNGARQGENAMNTMLLAMLAAGTTLAVSAPAEARGGCGPGFHRGYYGRCVPNRGPRFAPRRAPVVGVYYPGRGYWHANRYWHRRYRWHGGWRYR